MTEEKKISISKYLLYHAILSIIAMLWFVGKPPITLGAIIASGIVGLIGMWVWFGIPDISIGKDTKA